MDIYLIIIGFVLSTLFILGGYLVKYKKMYFFVSGYNMMNDEQKQKVNIEKIGILMFNYMSIVGITILLMTLSYLSSMMLVAKILALLLIPVIIMMLIHLQKYDGNNFENGKVKKSTIILLLLIIIMFILAEVILVYFLLSI
jgi:hypothetical protein